MGIVFYFYWDILSMNGFGFEVRNEGNIFCELGSAMDLNKNSKSKTVNQVQGCMAEYMSGFYLFQP